MHVLTVWASLYTIRWFDSSYTHAGAGVLNKTIQEV